MNNKINSSLTITYSNKFKSGNKPKVLFFDSGIGGLSILSTCQDKLQDQIEYFYCADSDFFPYSEKDPQHLKTHIVSLIKNLIAQYNLDMIVVACNTATILTIKDLRARIKIPFIGVEPALKPASQMISDNPQLTIGVLATKNTVQSSTIQSLITSYFPQNKVLLLGSTQLVNYAEQTIRNNQQSTKSSTLLEIFQPWLNNPPDIIILGCTHFPLISKQIAQIFPQAIFLDPNIGVANRIANLLNLQTYNLLQPELITKTFLTTAITINDQQELSYWGFNKFVRC